MTVFMKNLMLLRFATGVVFAVLPTTPASAQFTGYVMPANCDQSLDKCSQQIWAHNSFPHSGVTRSVTFTNGRTLTCTSNGANTPRTCDLSPAGRGSQASSGEPFSQENLGPGVTPVESVIGECAFLKHELDRMLEDGRHAMDTVDADRAYFDRVMDMTPAELEKEIQYAQSQVRVGSAERRQRISLRLDFLLDLRVQLAAANAGGATTHQMEARYEKILNEETELATEKNRANGLSIEDTMNRMAELGCDHPGAP
jgi:hypothetical protein